MTWTLLLLAGLVAYAQAQNCGDGIEVDYMGVAVEGPNSADIQRSIVETGKSGTMVDNSLGQNAVAFLFDPSTQIIRVEIRTRFAKRINVYFYDKDDNELDKQVAFPPNWKKEDSEDSTVIPTGGAVENVAKVYFTFNAPSGEFKVNNFQFFKCPPNPDEPCTCRLRGDPILDNCNSNLWFLGEGLYTFSESAQCGGYEVTIFNSKLNENPNALTVTEYMRIESQGNSIQIDRDAMVSINDDEAVPASDGPVGSWATILVNPNNYVSVQLNACGAVFQFWGQNMATRGMGIIPASIKGSASGKCHEDP